jgi:hypothetical protein
MPSVHLREHFNQTSPPNVLERLIYLDVSVRYTYPGILHLCHLVFLLQEHFDNLSNVFGAPLSVLEC